MEKTAMQQAIEFVEKKISELNPEMKSDHHKSVAYKTMIEEMKKLRDTVEKEQIINACEWGLDEDGEFTDIVGLDYYNETYENT